MEQYIVDVLNLHKYWDINDWTLGHNGSEPFAYSLNDGHQMIYITIYIDMVDKWMNDPRIALTRYQNSKNKPLHKILAGHFLQHGAPAYEQYPNRSPDSQSTKQKR
jgi:hypothetical protein